MEVLQEFEELVLVTPKDALYLRRLLRVGDEHLWADVSRTSRRQIRQADLEHVECLELDILALVPKEIHHHLQIRLARDIPGHHVEVRTIEQDLAEELERLALRDVIVRENQCDERREELRFKEGVAQLSELSVVRKLVAYAVIVLV